MRLVYVAHPLGGNIDANLARALRWYAHFVKHYPEVAFTMNWALTAMVLEDDDPRDRERGIQMNQIQLARCDGIWLCGGRLSSGMQAEALAVQARGGFVISFLDLGEEPPSERAEGRPIVVGGQER